MAERLFDVAWIKGQEYRFVRTEPYTRKDGSETIVEIWESHCAYCGKIFRTTRPANLSKLGWARRCSTHKMPGIGVRKLHAPVEPFSGATVAQSGANE